MKIAIDIMGGDFAPQNILEGVKLALFNSNSKFILIGNKNLVDSSLRNHPQISIIHTDKKMTMAEGGISAIKGGKDSSIYLASKLVHEKKADALISAGNTGATVACSIFNMRLLDCISRPAIATVLPVIKNNYVLILDVGATVDNTPEHLENYALMGSTYVEKVFNKQSPKVALLNIGEETSKGNTLVKKTYERFKKLPINFVGNIEGNHIFDGKVDVIVCDGFVGNTILKTSEGAAKFFGQLIRSSIKKNFIRKFGGLLLRKCFKNLKKVTSSEKYGGAPLLGVNGIVIIAHGNSSPEAIKNAIIQAESSIAQNINKAITEQITKQKPCPQESK